MFDRCTRQEYCLCTTSRFMAYGNERTKINEECILRSKRESLMQIPVVLENINIFQCWILRDFQEAFDANQHWLMIDPFISCLLIYLFIHWSHNAVRRAMID